MEKPTEKPRKLTPDEIKDILSVIPDIKSAADTVTQQNTKSMKALVKEQLEEIEITPLGISDLKSEIVRQYNNTVVQPGNMVGVTASDTFSKPITQMALNSFHSSGAAKNVSHGVERIEELIYATQNPKHTSCNIFFREFLSFDDLIIKKRPQITEITVQNLVIGIPDVEEAKNITEPFWYSLYRQTVRDDFESNYVLRLDINVNMLYAYKLTMEDVCNAIEQDETVICVYSPMSVGKIDVYPIEKLIASKLSNKGIISQENSSLVFLSTIIIPYLDQLRISGVSGIQQIYPEEAPVLQIVKEERKDVDDNWFLILNLVSSKKTGILPENLAKLCEVVGIKVTKTRPYYIAVKADSSPMKIIRDGIDAEERKEKEYNIRKKKDRSLPRWEPTELNIASKLVYADTTGSNFTELLAHPDIDSTRTICNNVHEIKNALGVEAARSFLIQEFINVLSIEGYINPRHIALLSDYMSSLGKIFGVTFTGMARQPIGALEKASIEKAMDVFKEAAGFGERKTVSGTSASIFIGKKALIGTGYSEDYIKPENLERYKMTRKQLFEDPKMTLDVNSFNDAIQEFTVGNKEDVAFLENMEEMMFGGELPLPQPEVKVQSTVVDKPLGVLGENIMIKGEITRSKELDQAAKELEAEMEKQVTCAKFKAPTITVSSGGVVKEKFLLGLTPMPPKAAKPKVQSVQIFSLEDYMK